MRGIGYKRFLAATFLALFIIPLAAEGQNEIRYVPVLKKAGDGNLLVRDLFPSAPEKTVRRRHFNFDRPSGRGFTRDGRPLLGAAAEVKGTWHVALLRIGFRDDRDDELSSISTGGDFILEPDDRYIIDPPPHDKAYFDAHMQGLRNYYDIQSCGKIDITWDIFPEEENGSFKLDDIADFGPGAGGSWTTQMLVEFVRAAAETADAEVNYSAYDAVIIAHAGASLQSDVEFDSPNDIPSFFVSLGDEDTFTVDGGLTVFRECSVIPESDIQDGYYGGIAAVLAHEFGHQLGLPDLYNTLTNYTGIGVWGNMGSGGQMGALIEEDGVIYQVDGIIPGGLCAWSRYYLGWTSTRTAGSFEDVVSLRAVENCPAEIVRVDISNDEYFLIENRCVETDGYPTGAVVDSETGVIIGTSNCLSFNEDGECLEWDPGFYNGYDMLLPTESPAMTTDAGPGLLIWHIDEQIISERWFEDIVNSLNPFGVRLMEANGVFDIGDPTSSFGLGWYDDAFHADYKDHLSDSTLPPAWSNLNVPSGITIDEISGRDTLMTFRVRSGGLISSGSFNGEIDVAEGGLVATGSGFSVLAVDKRGRGWLTGSPAPSFDIGSEPVVPPAYGKEFSSEGDAVVIADRSGYLHAFNTGSWNYTQGNWPVRLSGISSHPVIFQRDGSVVAACDTAGAIHLLDDEGVEFDYFEMPDTLINISNISVFSDENGYGESLIFMGAAGYSATRARLFWWNLSDDSYTTIPVTLPQPAGNQGAALLCGDVIPGEEGAEVYVALQESGEVMLCSRTGTIFRRDVGAAIVNIPAVADVNGDGSLDVILSDGENIFVIGPSGSNIRGWPRNVNDMFDVFLRQKLYAPLLVAAGGGEVYVTAVSTRGVMYTFDHRGEFASGAYPVKIAANVRQPLGMREINGEAAFYCLDVLENGEGSYYNHRPEIVSVDWRKGPVAPGNLSSSWAGLWGDAGRTGFAGSTPEWSRPAESWRDLEANLRIYPNPSSGDRVGFHFYAPSGSRARLQVMDIRGELVLEDKKVCLGGEEHEFPVSMGDKTSGIYIGRVVVTYQGVSAEAAKKFAIVK